MTISEARKLLGKSGNKYSNEMVQQSIETTQLLANIMIDEFLKLTQEEREKYKKPKTGEADQQKL